MFLSDYFICRFAILSEVTYVFGLAASNSYIRIDNVTPRTVFSLSIFFLWHHPVFLADDACHFECFSLAPGVSSIASYQKKPKTNMTPSGIVLASNSPRRKALLEKLRLRLEILPPCVNESRNAGENAKHLVERLAAEKARSVHAEDDCLVIAADTVVNLNEKVFGKPASKKEGFLMLSELSGKVHKVHTGVSMVFNQNWETFSVQTDVHFRELTDEMINWYWSLDESRDKAGSYSIQGAGSVLVEKIVGSYTNVVGLPLMETADMLAKFGVEIFKDNFSIN